MAKLQAIIKPAQSAIPKISPVADALYVWFRRSCRYFHTDELIENVVPGIVHYRGYTARLLRRLVWLYQGSQAHGVLQIAYDNLSSVGAHSVLLTRREATPEASILSSRIEYIPISQITMFASSLSVNMNIKRLDTTTQQQL